MIQIHSCKKQGLKWTDDTTGLDGISVLGIFTDRSSAHVGRVPKDSIKWFSHYWVLCTQAWQDAKHSFRRFPLFFLGSLERSSAIGWQFVITPRHCPLSGRKTRSGIESLPYSSIRHGRVPFGLCPAAQNGLNLGNAIKEVPTLLLMGQ